MCRNDSLRSGEGGAVSAVTLVAVLFFMLLFALVANVLRVTRHRVEVQAAGDAAAAAGAGATARGLNAVTAANHLLGELTALVALHEGLGGPELRQNKEASTADLRRLDALLRVARANPLNSRLNFVTDKALDPVRCGAALYDARLRLKEWTLIAHALLTAAHVAKASVFGAPAAPFLEALALAVAAKTYQELVVLDALERLARAQGPLIEVCTRLVPRVSRYARDVVRAYPRAARDAARDLAALNGAAGALHPARPALPVVAERVACPASPTAPRWPGRDSNPSRAGLPRADLRPLARSQWVRASYPWVDHWRRPVLDLMSWTLTLSGAAGRFREWSDYYTLARAYGAEVREGLPMYVLTDSAPAVKGAERWTTRAGSRRADELFTVVGFAHRPAPAPLAAAVFGSSDVGLLASAQAMAYNANPQTGPRRDRRLQPEVGWDTLNWGSPVPEFGADVDAGRPKIVLNWQAKLVPVTRLAEAVHSPDFPAAARAALRRAGEAPDLETH